MKDGRAWLVASASGLALWSAASVLEGRQEPWDSEAYWSIYLPLAAGICLLLGLIFPKRPWRWPLAVMLAQLPVMIVSTGEVGALLVLGTLLLLALSLPGMLFAWPGASVRRWLAA